MQIKNFTTKDIKSDFFLIVLISFIIPWTRVLAQDAGKTSPQSKHKTETKKEVKKNGPQPVRYNQKRLANDPNSPFYDPTYSEPVIDNVQSRFEFDFERLKDPSTGEIPDNIRQRELEFVLSPKSKLQIDPSHLQLRSGEFDPGVAGDQESVWVNRGPYNVGGRTRALAIDLDDEDIILAGGVSGGMWRTTNQGTSWTKVTASEQHPGITDVVQDPRAGFHDIWYYSTGERIGASANARNWGARYAGKGIYKSTDNGLTWVLLTATQNLNPQLFSGNPFAFIFGLDVHPTTGDLYVATFDGIQRSTDGGTTFTEVLPADLDNFADIHIASDGVIYATLDNGRGFGGIFRTTDGALGTWIDITTASFPARFGRTVIYSSPSSPEILYILASGTPRRTIGHDFWKYTYVSGDGSGAGGTWEDRSANLPAIGGRVGNFTSQGGYDQYVRVHPTDPDFVLIGGTNMYRSTDGFATQATITSWIGGYSTLNNVSIYSNHHPDQQSLEFFPSNPDKVISGHDGGISITTDITTSTSVSEPVAWTSLNNGYLTTQVYALSIGPTDQLIAGFQDNGTWFTNNTDPTDSWVRLNGGDGSYNAFNSTGELRYVSSQSGNVRRIRYADANTTELPRSNGLSPVSSNNDFFLFVAPFELDSNDDEIMYLAQGTNLWRNDDLPNATRVIGWRKLTNVSTSAKISSIGISESPANVVYIGTIEGQVYRIDNANVGNPASIDVFSGKGLPRGNVASIDVNPFNSNDVVIAFSNYSIISVFHSTDGGSTWENISGNLEENVSGTGAGPSVRWVASVGNRDRYFAGTSTGLYSTVRLDGTRTVWTQEDLAGIKNTVVEQIRTRDSDGLVVIGTHGNGLYSGSFETSVPVVVANAINDLVVEVNSADMQVDVSNIFVSNESPPLPVTVSVESNSNSALVTATVSENSLTLSYLPDAFGRTTITLRGEDANTNFALANFSIRVKPPPVTTFPYTQNFDNGLLPLDWEKSGSMVWVINKGGTLSRSTGPEVDNTLMNVIGSYIYSEASDHNEGDEAVLLTRKIDLRGLPNPFVEFAYHMYGSTMGTLKVEVLDVTDPDPVNHTETQIFTVSEQQQEQADPYLTAKIDLSAFSSSIVRLKFTSVRGSDFNSDIALDDISVEGTSPNAPTNLTAEGSEEEGIALNWTDNADNEADFLIERFEDGTTFTELGTTVANVTSYRDASAVASINYSYRVAARNAGGTSAYSNTAESIITSIPVAPSSLTAEGSETAGIALNWTDNANNEVDFVIERSEDGTTFTELGTTVANVTSYRDASAVANISYSYRVAARNTLGTSAYSNTAVFLITGIEDEFLSQSIKISPNPSDGTYSLSVNDIKVRNILVWNSVGKLIMRRSFDLNNPNTNVELDIRHEEPGLYLFRIELEDGRAVIRKLIKN